MKNKNQIVAIFLSVTFSVLVIGVVVQGVTTISNDIVTGGTITAASASTTDSLYVAGYASSTVGLYSANVLNIGGAATLRGGVTIATSTTGLTFPGQYTTTAIQLGTSLVKMELASYDDHVIDIYVTSDSTDVNDSVRPIHMVNTMTGVGGVGGRAEFEMNTEVILGAWANALKGYTDFGDDGQVTGLGSAVLAEMRMPNKALTGGNYAPMEIELVVQENSVTTIGTPVSFIHAQVQGHTDGVTNYQENGYIMSLLGLGAATAGEVFDEIGSVTPTHQLRILIGTTEYFIMLQATQ